MPLNDSLKYVLKTLGGIFLIFKIFLSLLARIEYNLNCYWSTDVIFLNINFSFYDDDSKSTDNWSQH